MLRRSWPVRLAGLAVAALLALPLGWGLAHDDRGARSLFLGRPLAALPGAATWAGDPHGALRGAAAFLEDRMAGPVPATRALARLRYHGLGDPGSDAVIRNGALLFNAASDAGGRLVHVILRRACGRPDDGGPWLAPLIANSRALAAALAGPGRRVSFLAVPGKPVVYADRLPAAVAPDLRAACLSTRAAPELFAWVEALTAAGIVARYPLRRFEAMRDRPHFYPPENFHTEGMAAHLAAWDLLEALKPGHPPAGSVPFAAETRRSDLTPLIGFSLEVAMAEPDYGPATPRRAHAEEKRLAELLLPEIPRGRWLRVWRNPAPGATGRAVVFGNSFALYVPQHLAPGFREVIAVPNNALLGPDLARVIRPLIAEVQPQEVIFLMNDAYAVRFQLEHFRVALDN
ncbi:hypothetical protein LNKW23_03660 [Paralimibaculum aggregatum]|uniref:AlgX/AlgJ SGNH hydrolase-like domain-containing protein n=1 Tax=Paralimibaculum aggregatum TaxID=3036245 RepID=A0ABQ6LCQ6_9RHOB|nr:hypothetical protein [Limibaculum sp. NKW23]GMG81154.1 hypothetical protein LNKW23_03660 [Limibaculum sp. NKW23]